MTFRGVGVNWDAVMRYGRQLELARGMAPDPTQPLATGPAQAALGQQGGSLFGVPSSTVAAILLADYTDAIASSPVEARGLVGDTFDIAVPGGEAVEFTVTARGGGGLFIERIAFSRGDGAFKQWFVERGATPQTNTLGKLDVGGRATEAEWHFGTVNSNAGVVSLSHDVEREGLRFFVTPGDVITFRSNGVGGATREVRIECWWRELLAVGAT